MEAHFESKADDFLSLLSWGLEILLNPSPAKVLQMFAGGDDLYLRKRIRQLERSKLIQRQGDGRDRSYRMTARGRTQLGGGVDPGQRWQRSWDGDWRVLSFDIPARKHATRLRLWRWLRSQRFGYLQKSVWISPDPFDEATLPFLPKQSDPESCLVMLSRPAPRHSQEEIVKGAWDFACINRLYSEYLLVLGEGETLSAQRHPCPVELSRWVSWERLSWLKPAAMDPFLPKILLPTHYLGEVAWQRRKVVMTSILKNCLEPG